MTRFSTRQRFADLHRQARLGNLGCLATSLGRAQYEWLLTEVYDLRHPHVGSDRHLRRRNFDSLQGKLTIQSGARVRVING